MSEEALIEGLQRGDRKAFEAVYEKYNNKVYAVALAMMKDEHDALDVCQDVFIKVYKNGSSMKGKSSLFTWIYRITVNMCIDKIRKAGRRVQTVSVDEPEIGIALPDSRNMPEERLSKKTDAIMVRNALQKLSADMRTVIILREFEGLSYDDIARITGQSLGTVKSRISRARESLRKIILENGEHF